MNWNQIEGSWKQAQGRVREKWGKLTDDDLELIAGKRDQLVGVLQRKYGEGRDEIERQVAEFERADLETM
jgi:uncharacterized protein YjbJ (UPF0337 family)